MPTLISLALHQTCLNMHSCFLILAVCLYVPLLYSSALCWWTCDPRSELWGASLRQQTRRTCPRRLSRCRTRSGTSKHTDTICSTDSHDQNGHNIISENRQWIHDTRFDAPQEMELTAGGPTDLLESHKPLRNGYQSSPPVHNAPEARL